MGESREVQRVAPENQFFEKIFALVSSNIRAWQAFGAAIALVGSIVAAGLGTVLSVLGWFLGGQRFGPLLDQIGTILFFLTIPLLMFAAHCLDLLERECGAATVRERASRQEAGSKSLLKQRDFTDSKYTR